MKDLESVKELISILETLPSIGKKSAARIAYEIARDRIKGLRILDAIENVVSNVRECSKCGSLSEYEVCSICDSKRDKIVAVVESSKDIEIIEESGSFGGYYFVFNDSVEKLREFILNKGIKEVIFAFSPSVENEIKMRKIKEELGLNIECYSIAKGVPMGVSLENVDISSINFAFLGKILLD
ncbi:MAG: recombination protein RecR [Nautiliaceae bacterium]